jgi:hypothetical protein
MATLAELSILSEEDRYEASIKLLIANKEGFVLSDNGGMVTMGTDNDETSIIPFWPTAEAALTAAVGDWSKCKPESFDLDELLEYILPELIEDKQLVAIFPTLQDDGMILDAADFADDLKEQLN